MGQVARRMLLSRKFTPLWSPKKRRMNPPHQDPIVSLERIVSLLSGIPSFEILDPTLLQKIALLLGVEQHPEGTEIIHEDRFGDRLYLIESGVVGVYTGGPTGPLLLGKLGEG
ncbi:MAG: hypothetical protein RLZZ399_2504, partial [Verrucomicrobiota bacterium]